MNLQRLKVLQVGKYYPPHRGGMETVLELLCRHLKDRVDLEVVVANAEKTTTHEVIDGVLVTRMGTCLKPAGAPVNYGLLGILRNAKADIVHIHTPHPFALFFYLLAGSPSQLVIWYHSDIVRQRLLELLIRPLQNNVMQKAKAIFVSSQKMIDNSAVLQRHRERCVVVPFGIEDPIKTEAVLEEAARIRDKFGNGLILAVGRLVYYKGFEIAVQAMADCTIHGKLLIVGEGPDREKLSDAISQLNLANKVFLIGNVENTAPYFEACDLFILPSIAKSEAFGIVQLEAMSYGKPVINTWLDSGVPSISLDGETGMTVPPSNKKALGEAIKILLNDKKLRERYGCAARKRFLSEYTAEGMAQKVFSVYQSCSKSS